MSPSGQKGVISSGYQPLRGMLAFSGNPIEAAEMLESLIPDLYGGMRFSVIRHPTFLEWRKT